MDADPHITDQSDPAGAKEPDGDARLPVVVAQRVQARSLYWRGWSITQIANELDLPYTTVSSWKSRHQWDKASPLERAEDGVTARYLALVAKEAKTGHDFKEIDLLGRQIERLARVGKYQNGGNEADLNPKVANRNSPEVLEKKAKAKNLITFEMAEKLREDMEANAFGHQSHWLSSTSLRTRMILKSRQIGATYHFARERFVRALETGNNQIFISASRAQANIFRQYIVQWVQKVCGVTLKGDPIVVQRTGEDGEELDPFELYFLGTNYRTAQGYHGDVIIDEAFWIYGFEELFKVASAMATQKQYTITLFSTPSTLAHEAYPMWCGDRFNRRRAKADRIRLDISHEALKGGVLGADGIWRQIVTLQDAIDGGFDLVDPDQLQIQYSVDEFDNLFRCVFLDDSQSMFPFQAMRKCMVDSWDVWRDLQPYALRPLADQDVWLGYDPNGDETGMGDKAALAILSPPAKVGGKFRVIEKARLQGLDFEGQAEAIKAMCGKYNVTKMGIDTTGVGKAVYQLVLKFFPMAEAINYSVQTKTALVLKAKNVITSGRLEFDAGWLDVAQAFMAIHPQITKGGTQVTYVASRAGGQGHADLAFAIMHALQFEPLDITEPPGGGSTVEIC
jgi:uncharacterized protein YjcR